MAIVVMEEGVQAVGKAAVVVDIISEVIPIGHQIEQEQKKQSCWSKTVEMTMTLMMMMKMRKQKEMKKTMMRI